MGIKIMIRQLTSDDFTQFKKLCEAQHKEAELPESNIGSWPSYLKKIKQILISNTDNVFVMFEDNKMIGYTIGTINEIPWNDNRFGDIGMFFVNPEHRNKRNADNLWNAIVDWFEQNQCRYVMASVFLFKENCEADKHHIDRASAYFQSKGMNWCGNFFVKGLNE
tara:strand:+ start:16464 stop:16958 length:495 start_codon:yes stop_codon:yes gene_type:complete